MLFIRVLSRSLSSAKKYPQGSGGMGFKAHIARLTLEAATLWHFVGTTKLRMVPPRYISPSSRMQFSVIPRTYIDIDRFLNGIDI